ncbi:KDO II ethanolaminephosphotransferase [Izhakiella capsodis]|uniref:KDO II ethanolaminephosphotransferase n=1 Tax=Izhakiella capsodis TaxID=1367852 RepID=A0A1I4ZR94_9GAMM|nr:KDO II ethanolaminephosphotransferase [Izhakiella capsodis]
MFYTVDHGESISDNMYFHGTPRNMAPTEQFCVPMIFCSYDTWLAKVNKESAFDRLKAQQRAGVTHRHAELFDTIMGYLAISRRLGSLIR